MTALALYLQQDPPFGAMQLVSPSSQGLGDFRLRISYESASRLEFTATAAEYALPFDYQDFIVLYDADDPSQGLSSPLFEGFVEEITPGSRTNEVRIVAYDPTVRASRGIMAMSHAWELVNNRPVEGSAAYPRFVANVTIDNDDDYAYSAVQDATLGGIIRQLLDDAQIPLYFVSAVPGDGTPSGSSSGYVLSELEALAVVPQEKIVATAEPVVALIRRLLQQFAPDWRMIWIPGQRRFRFVDLDNLTQRTVVVNKGDASYPVVNLQIHRSLEGRYGAVTIYGPQAVEWRTALCSYPAAGSDTLADTSTYGQIGETPNTGTCRHHWTITDPEFNRIARRGNTPVAVGTLPVAVWANEEGTSGSVIAKQTHYSWYPTLSVRYPDGEGGDDDWYVVRDWIMDPRAGTVELVNACLYRIDPDASGSQIIEPDFVRFIYPNMISPLFVRYPASGYEGTIYTVAGIENELRIYDEQLATGFNFVGSPVTDAERIAKFQAIAQRLHAERKNIIYAGGITLDGLDYEWRGLRRAVNVGGEDENGNAVTTGWEAIAAPLTEVEYDLEDGSTTLFLSSDLLELIGVDADQLKQALGVRDRATALYATQGTIFTLHDFGGLSVGEFNFDFLTFQEFSSPLETLAR